MKFMFAFSLFLFASLISANEEVYDLNPFFKGASQAKFSVSGSEGDQVLHGELIVKGKKSIPLPDVCEHEGTDPELYDAYTVSTGADKSYFVFTCKWVVMHTGINLRGVDYISYVYSGSDIGKLNNVKDLADDISGYEGSLEEGGNDYYWYSTRGLASRKLKELVGGTKLDSLELSHEIVLARLKDMDFDAIKSYLTKEKFKVIFEVGPLSKSNSRIYNDLGFALGESGLNVEAYDVLSKVEVVAPERLVLKLNIADVLWDEDKEKSINYYQAYIAAMKAQNKEKLIPVRAIERSAKN